jgi:hypothetical protein
MPTAGQRAKEWRFAQGGTVDPASDKLGHQNLTLESVPM